jgi:23S rRNA (guanosine2251-2'-O)-methyltransferase
VRDWIYGRNPVREVLRADRRRIFSLHVAEGVQRNNVLTEIIRLCHAKGVPVSEVHRSELDAVTPRHQGVVLEVSGYPYARLEDMLELARKRGEDPLLLILDTLQDPQNFGALLRTAEAVGVHGVLLPHRRTTKVTPAVVSVSSGASEHLFITQTNLARGIELLKTEGVWICGLESGAKGCPPEEIDLSGPLAIVVGSEAQGMRRLVQQSCDMLLRFPMRGKVDSLNASVAGSVALYLAWQARGYQGRIASPRCDSQ